MHLLRGKFLKVNGVLLCEILSFYNGDNKYLSLLKYGAVSVNKYYSHFGGESCCLSQAKQSKKISSLTV
jgi:hypothetical protein